MKKARNLISRLALAGYIGGIFGCLAFSAYVIFLWQPPARTASLLSASVASTPTWSSELSASPSAGPTADRSLCSGRLAALLDQVKNYPLSHNRLFGQMYNLAFYRVDGNALSQPILYSVPDDLKKYQQDLAFQSRIWHFVASVIPPDERAQVSYFYVYTDGLGGSLGSISQGNDPDVWSLNLDIVDSADFPSLATTVVHELGHLLSLNDSQVPVDQALLDHPNDGQVYAREAAACPTYFTRQGCSLPDSYLNRFFQSFWPAVYDEWKAIDAETDEQARDRELSRFYDEQPGQFVSRYAVTRPAEDLAESWLFFILAPRPAGKGLAEQKIAFFYAYPELVSLRTEMLDHLCQYVDQP